MKTTIHVEGFLDLVLQRAVDFGIARSKTDALRIGVLELNKQYRLVENPEAELVIEKMERMEAENKALGRKPLSEEDVLRKYPELRKVKA